ncbi:hypothetical protein SAMN02745885_01801 [Carboxydocella sporoproducens DSM 16521]|uniref:t-SNARE coiled-coil homology domain-containing protein n=2 Tax=Carboxydocella TaxID=178898 RepID=A0A1T4QU62_9FIRM|nr:MULTISPECIES: hypothetical protein [Carboxydocella]AVX21650.1 hypothetical protein CFE_2507 [Carboxydocella thermautotrophica]AVX32061.1 hypothetical protein CTH_2522 [Carboxydocella thermautotrophica]SKA07302.1 hypothetical protein SAMN02745885_01801 [Carboxydocella sporoproducens DSM 16521]
MVITEEPKSEQAMMVSRINELEAMLAKRLERLETRFDLVEERLDDVEDRLYYLDERIMDLEDRGMDLQEQLDTVEENIINKMTEVQQSIIQMDENFRALLCICARQGLKLEKLENKLRHKDLSGLAQPDRKPGSVV